MIYSQAQVLLGTALVNGVSPNMRDALNVISAEMLPDAFCREIYKAVMALDNFNATVTLEAVRVQMGNVEFYQLADFSKDLVYTREPMREAQQVKSYYSDQKAITDMKTIIDKMSSGRVYDRDEVSQMLQGLSVSVAPTSETKPKFFSEYQESYLKILEERERNPNGSYLDIGLEVEINKTDLIVLGGQPAMGKTALALYINDYVASQGKEVLLFSLEMDGDQLFEREVSAKAKISSRSLKRVGQDPLADYQWGNIGKALEDLSNKPVAIDDNAKLSIPMLIKKCKDFKEQYPNTALITVDYLTLMELPGASNQNLAVAEATRQLKVLAKDLKTPILILSQLNREAAKARREPMNSDLRDSGAIEQDADKIIFPFRDEVFDENSPNKGLAKILKTKVRDGETGSVILGFENGSFCKSNSGWSDVEIDKPIERQKF